LLAAPSSAADRDQAYYPLAHGCASPILRLSANHHSDVPIADQTNRSHVPIMLAPIAIGDAQRSHALNGCSWSSARATNPPSACPPSVGCTYPVFGGARPVLVRMLLRSRRRSCKPRHLGRTEAGQSIRAHCLDVDSRSDSPVERHVLAKASTTSSPGAYGGTCDMHLNWPR